MGLYQVASVWGELDLINSLIIEFLHFIFIYVCCQLYTKIIPSSLIPKSPNEDNQEMLELSNEIILLNYANTTHKIHDRVPLHRNGIDSLNKHNNLEEKNLYIATSHSHWKTMSCREQP